MRVEQVLILVELGFEKSKYEKVLQRKLTGSSLQAAAAATKGVVAHMVESGDRAGLCSGSTSSAIIEEVDQVHHRL